MNKKKFLCDENCNECAMVNSKNGRMLTVIMNELYNKYGDGVLEIILKYCPMFSVCYDCRVNHFCHSANCELINDIDEDKVRDW